MGYSYAAQDSSCPDGNLTKAHAATGAGTNAYCYDPNGNMVRRTIAGVSYNLEYDPENRLAVVKQGTTTIASFTYDGDGKRVKGTVNGVTTTYIGDLSEWTGSTGTLVRYYYADGVRVAMKKGSTVYYLLGDHMGSTSVVATSSGGLQGKQLYKAWGEPRYASASLPTAYTYTGQYSYTDDIATPGTSVGFGLMFYKARWYDPYRNLGKRPFERIDEHLAEQNIVPPVLEPAATTEDQLGAQSRSRAVSEAALDGGEHRATIDSVAGGNGGSGEVVKVLKPREKSQPIVRHDD